MSRQCRRGVRWAWVLTMLVAFIWAMPASAQDPGSGVPAAAPTDDEWSYVITPQVWISHILKNGFSSPNTIAGLNCGGPTAKLFQGRFESI